MDPHPSVNGLSFSIISMDQRVRECARCAVKGSAVHGEREMAFSTVLEPDC